MRRVFLIGCGKSKRPSTAPARELYTGQLFKKSLAYAEAELGERREGEAFVLSAMHGLVALDQELAPYELTLNGMPKAERCQWGAGVARELHTLRLLSADTTLVFLAGAAYVAAVAHGIREIGRVEPSAEVPELLNPLAGLSIGGRLQWLNVQLAERRCRSCGCTNADCGRCIERTGGSCFWVMEDLCSACAGDNEFFRGLFDLEPYPETDDYDWPECPTCGAGLDWEHCDQCGGEGLDGHDCGDDTCCCLYPEDNLSCEQCDGAGGWWRCFEKHDGTRSWTPRELKQAEAA